VAPGVARAGVALAGVRISGHRAAGADDLCASAGMRGPGAVVAQRINRGSRCEGRELLEALDGLEQQMRRAVTTGGLARHEDAPVGAEVEPILGEGRAQERPAARLQARAIVGGGEGIQTLACRSKRSRCAWRADHPLR
jgi:hypothetical protein